MTPLPFAGELTALAAAFVWATATMIYARMGSQMPAMFLNLIKASVAVGFLGLTVFLLGDTLPELEALDWMWLAGSGLVGISIGDSAYLAAIRRIGPAQTLLVESLAPPLTGILALLFLHEAIGLWAWAGIFVTMAGVLWVVTEHQPHGRIELPGLGFAALAALCQAVGMVMSREVMVNTPITPLWASLVRLAAASLALWIFLPITQPSMMRRETWESMRSLKVWTLFILAVFLGTFLGIWLQQAALKLTSAAIAQTLVSVSPLFALGLARLGGQKISRRSLLGSIIAMIGIALFFR